MVFVLFGTLLVIGLLVYFYHQRPPKQSGIPCDRTEDTGFYEDLEPDSLPHYQETLLQIFSLLDASHFEGTHVQLAKRHSVEQLIADAAANQQVNPKYLRVMLYQFLHSDVAVRRQEEMWEQWAQKVYTLDQNQTHSDSRRIPSAWKVYFRTALENSDQIAN